MATSLISGNRLGPYEILALVGTGGMGEVYRAKDTRLDRIVAIKILSAHLSNNPDFRQRFEREAHTISSISHPHICALYDIGHQDGIDYIVMEFLEGETLAEKIQKGPLSVEQVLRYGIEIADALDKAHKQGIIHRDLKPGNIMITKSGAKLLDFGLAKFKSPAGPTMSGVSALATEGPRDLTAEGTILGTFQYMSPEQLEGKETDSRTDIFSLGLVLYETATGRKAFIGKSPASLIAAILSSEPPPISSIQPLAPPALDRVVKVCLSKDPDDRWQTSHDVMLELKWIAEGSSQAGVPVPVAARRKLRERIAWALASLFFVLFAVFAGLHFLRQSPSPPIMRVSILPPSNNTFWNSIISPDGLTLAFISFDSNGKSQIWFRPLDSAEAKPLPQTQNASWPFWSPDSRSIAFFQEGQLKKIEIPGGQPVKICDAPPDFGRGGAWSKYGTIVFANHRVFYTVPAGGGTAKPLTKLASKVEEHDWPCFLSDGRHFVFLADANDTEDHHLMVGSLDSGQSKVLLSSFVSSVACSDQHLFYVRGGTLMAQAYDASKFALVGEAFPVADQVAANGDNHHFDFSTSRQGVVSYRKGSPNTQMMWVNRNGEQLGKVGEPGRYAHIDLSPDGTHVLAERLDSDERNGDLWLFDLNRGTSSRLTFDPAWDMSAYWSPDGNKIVFSSTRDSYIRNNLYLKSSSGAGEDQLLLKSENQKYTSDWSDDGKYIIYWEGDPKSQTSDIWLLPVAGGKPIPYLVAPFSQYDAQLSPDGKWMAYGSDESGISEIYVQPFPTTGSKWQISTNGGWSPKWRRDGKELFFMGPDQRLHAVEIKTTPTFDASVPKTLFAVHGKGMPDRYEYAVSPDGQRFLICSVVEELPITPITLILNWRGKENKDTVND
jgi:eukaryotic-like serine/threonine-protein kinase